MTIPNQKKQLQSYKNDDITFVVNSWFEHHTTLTRENYDMLKTLVRYMRTKKMKCCLCGKDIEKVDNWQQAEPLKAGRCCDACNMDKVIPARLKDYSKFKGDKK